MRVIEDLIAEDLVAYDGFDEASAPGTSPGTHQVPRRRCARNYSALKRARVNSTVRSQTWKASCRRRGNETADDDGERNLQKDHLPLSNG